MHNEVIAKSLTRIRKKPWEALIFILSWLSLELTKERLLSWLNSRIDRKRDAALHVLWIFVSWTLAHPVELALVFAVAYCLFVIIQAQGGTRQGKRLFVYSKKLGEVGFVRQREPLGYGWTSTVPGGERPWFLPSPEAPIPNSVEIQGPWDPGIDHAVKPLLGFCKRVKYAAAFPGDAAVYMLVKVVAQDGSIHKKWLQHVLGLGNEPIGDIDMKDERKIFVSGKPLGHNWSLFDLFLPDEVERAYSGEGFTYSALITIRLRGSLSISPVELYGN